MSVMTNSKIFKPEFALPAGTYSAKAKRGMALVNLLSLGIVPPIQGGARGFHAEGDLTHTVDGVDINQLWRDYQEFLEAHNAKRNVMLNFLTWKTTKAFESEFAGGSMAEMEPSTEFGEPVGVRPENETRSLGYTFRWYDIGARFTWQYLAEAESSDIDAVADMVAEADNRGLFMEVMRTLFDNNRRTNKEGNVVYPFFSGVTGANGDKPDDFGTTQFADGHNHYVTSGGATVTTANLEALQTLVREHGYKSSNGYSLILMINEAQEGTIRNFRSTANGGTGTYDFIPSAGTPGILLPVDVRVADGTPRPPATLQGVEVVGSYSEMTIVKSDYIPAGYMVLFVTGGEEKVQNPIAIREHKRQNLRGLRIVKGRTPGYPLIDSFWNRGFGTGVRKRGAGAIMQITANPTYAVPAAYAR